MRSKAIEDIKRKITSFNYVMSFTIFVLLFLIITFVYLKWDFITKLLVIGMLSIAAALILMGFFLSNQMSKQVVTTMENYHNNLKCLVNLSFTMTGENNEDAVLEKILKYATILTDAKAACILLMDKDMLFVKTAVGLDSKKMTGVSIPKTKGIAGWAVQSGEYVIVNDVKNDKRFSPQIDSLTGYETNSMLCVPLKVKGKVIGVLELINKILGTFTPEDAETIFYFANQAAMVIDISRFYDNQKNFEIHLTGILLDAIDNTFPEKRGHSLRVAKYALLVARALNMSEEEQKKLYRASLLHDSGFLKLNPKDILSMDKYKLHPLLAYEMLRVIHFYSDIAPIVLQHHERYDGQGYPLRLKGQDIQLGSRIIAIAETFDAMVSQDSYKSFTYDLETAIEKLKDNAGTQFDPQLVKLFIKNINPESVYSQT
jgi:HD-GYP domain-containing protein (c-di-GMP phosphodiesterase class II)